MAADRGVGGSFEFDSAGTESYHVGDPPDRRAIARGAIRGYDLAPLRARRVNKHDFEAFDLILAMDSEHFDALERLCPTKHQHKLRMFLAGSESFDQADVPDPYYGTDEDFDLVLDMCEDVIPRLLQP
jgi:protein-tyrosine phosphatase